MSEHISKTGLIQQFIGGFRLLLIGIVIVAVVELVLWDEMSLLYPYLNPGLLNGLVTFGILGYLIPGTLLILLCKWGVYVDPPQRSKVPPIVRGLYFVTGVTACLGILGIRNGVKIFIMLAAKTDVIPTDETDYNPTEAMNAYRWFLRAGGIYLLVFGLLMLAVIMLIQVVTVDLIYPDVTQALLVGLEVWIWGSLLGPAIIYWGCSFGLTEKASLMHRTLIEKILLAGSIVAMISIFGLSIGVTLIQKRWMIRPIAQ
jgi:hypothetical protein